MQKKIQEKLKIEYLSKEELKPYANNAKVHTGEQIEQIKKSIEQFGFNDPIAVWKDNEIVEGHGRLLAVMEMDEVEKVPVIRLDNLTDEQRKAYMIVHNKIAERSSWNDEILGDELKEIIGDFDLTELGFGEFELSMLTEDFDPVSYQDDEVIEEYGGKEDEYLAKKRIIITYTDEEEDLVKELINQDEIKKVVYDITEITE